jgi:hypothetical protein
MTDNNLVDELDAASLRIGGIAKLSLNAAALYLQRLAEAYVDDPSNLRWWESLKVRPRHLTYGNADGLSLLANLVGERNDAMLVVTDDEEPPWSVYSGDVQRIIVLLRETRFFEYILAAHDLSWIVFDTHLNELVSVGFEGTNPGIPEGSIT